MNCLSCGQTLKDNREASEHLTLRRQLNVRGDVVAVTPICNRTDRPG